MVHTKPESETKNVKCKWYVNDGAHPNGSPEVNFVHYDKKFRVSGR
jgi:hypothetical protein